MTAALLSTQCHDNGISRIKGKNGLKVRTNLRTFLSSRFEMTTMNRTLQRRENDAMICAECFCAKGDTNTVRWSCQNPKCYFYFSARAPSRRADSFSEIPKTLAIANEPIFGRDASRDRRRNPLNSSSDVLQSPLQKESVWGYHPQTTHLQSQNSLCVEQKSRSLSISELHKYHTTREKARLMRTRMMSVPGPVCIEPLEQDNDLIEDAFLSSPLPDFGEDVTTIGTEVSLLT